MALATSQRVDGGPLDELMGSKMNRRSAQKHGNRLTVERGGLYATRPARKVVQSNPMTWKLDEEMAAAFAGITGEDGSVPSKGLYCIRDRTQHPWRVLARRFIEARDAKASLEDAIGPLRVFENWVRQELWGEQPNHGRAA